MSAKAKVLIIDDQEGIRKVLAETCLALGYDVLTAYSGENALEIAASEIAAGNDIRVALVDMKMPGFNGIETLQGLSALDPLIKTYLMTGFGEGSMLAEAIEHGACGVLQKPFSLEQIKDSLEKAFLPENKYVLK